MFGSTMSWIGITGTDADIDKMIYIYYINKIKLTVISGAFGTSTSIFVLCLSKNRCNIMLKHKADDWLICFLA